MDSYPSIHYAMDAYMSGKRSRAYVEKYIICTFMGTRDIIWYGDTWEARDAAGKVLARGSASITTRY